MFQLLCTKMVERIVADRRAQTVAMANAVGMAFGGEEAQRAWRKSQEAPEVGQAPSEEAALRQQGTIMRLASLFGHQRSRGLKGAIKIKRPD